MDVEWAAIPHQVVATACMSLRQECDSRGLELFCALSLEQIEFVTRFRLYHTRRVWVSSQRLKRRIENVQNTDTDLADGQDVMRIAAILQPKRSRDDA